MFGIRQFGISIFGEPLPTVAAQIAATDSSDTTSITAANWRTAQIAATDSSDTTTVTAANWRTSQIAATDSSDTTVITAANWRTAQIAANDNSDVTSITGSTPTPTPSGIDPVFFILGINKLSA